MLNLMRKDFLIAKKMWIIVLILYWIVPIFLGYMSDDRTLPASITLSVISILLGMMMLSSVIEEEEKYPKVAALITTIGYKRSTQVISRYVLALLLYIYCLIVYAIESQFVANLLAISPLDFAISFFGFTFMMSLYLAIVLKYGVRAGRYIMALVILMTSLGPTLIVKLGFRPDISFLMNLGETALISLFIALGLLFYLISLTTGMRIYKAKEL